DKEIDSWTLYITTKLDWLDISKHIVRNIYKSHKWKDVSYPYMILTVPLSNLKTLGYPVDRIMQQQLNAQQIIGNQVTIDSENENLLSNIALPMENSSVFSQSQSKAPQADVDTS